MGGGGVKENPHFLFSLFFIQLHLVQITHSTKESVYCTVVWIPANEVIDFILQLKHEHAPSFQFRECLSLLGFLSLIGICQKHLH